MDKLVKNFLNNHPEAAAEAIEHLPHDQLLAVLEQEWEAYAPILSYLSPIYLSKILIHINIEHAAQLLKRLKKSQAANALRTVSKADRQVLIHALEPAHQEELERLLQYPRNEVGYYVESYPYTVSAQFPIKKVFEMYDMGAGKQGMPIYIVDKEHRLLGYVSTVRLIQHRDAMTHPVQVCLKPLPVIFPASTPLKQVIAHGAWTENKVVPVVGKQQNFLGVISREQIKNRTFKSANKMDKRTPLEEYMFFSELIWTGLQRFWGSLR